MTAHVFRGTRVLPSPASCSSLRWSDLPAISGIQPFSEAQQQPEKSQAIATRLAQPSSTHTALVNGKNTLLDASGTIDTGGTRAGTTLHRHCHGCSDWQKC